jgi:hypothetical protein
VRKFLSLQQFYDLMVAMWLSLGNKQPYPQVEGSRTENHHNLINTSLRRLSMFHNPIRTYIKKIYKRLNQIIIRVLSSHPRTRNTMLVLKHKHSVEKNHIGSVNLPILRPPNSDRSQHDSSWTTQFSQYFKYLCFLYSSQNYH